jgi:hypothetical protein
MADFCRELEANLAEAQGGTAAVAPAPPPARPRAPRRQGANPWPIVLALLVLIAIGAAIALLLANHNSNNTTSTGGGGGGGGTPTLKAISAYDPFGTGGENDSNASKATDNNPSTYWETERYYNAPSLNKPGVGLVLDAGSDVQLHQFGVVTSTPGFNAVIRAGDSPTQFPDTVSAPQTVSGTGVTFTITGKPHRYYLLWITRLGPNYNTARINEIKAT